MQKTVLSLAACLLALAAAGAHAQALWKWRDASGQLHISDTAPPPGTPSKDILSGPPGGVAPVGALVPKTATAAGDKASDVGSENALDKKKKAADKEKADKDKADRAALDARNATARRENCSRAQDSLRALQSGVRIARVNDKGEREYIDDAQRASDIKYAQDAVKSSCGPAPAGQ